MKLRLDFNLILGEELASFPAPVLKDGVELPPPPPAPPAGEPRPVMKIPQSIVLTEEDGLWSGTYAHPHWGEMPAIDVSVSSNHISFSAPSGNDDKGGQPVYFNFAFARADSTDNVAGFSAGRAPFFRSFLPAEGTVTVLED